MRNLRSSGHHLLHRPGGKVRRAGGAVTTPERHRHVQRPAPRVDVVDNLIIGKPRRPAVMIVQGHKRMVAGRMLQNQLHEKLELIRACQLWPGLVASHAHNPACPPMTLTSRNRAGDAAWVIQPDWPGWPFPHVMNPYRRRCDRSATPSQLPQNSGVIP